jgi:hypothetical protein
MFFCLHISFQKGSMGKDWFLLLRLFSIKFYHQNIFTKWIAMAAETRTLSSLRWCNYVCTAAISLVIWQKYSPALSTNYYRSTHENWWAHTHSAFLMKHSSFSLQEVLPPARCPLLASPALTPAVYLRHLHFGGALPPLHLERLLSKAFVRRSSSHCSQSHVLNPNPAAFFYQQNNKNPSASSLINVPILSMEFVITVFNCYHGEQPLYEGN